MRLRPLHLGISVADLDRSIAWYTGLLGFRLRSRSCQRDLDCELCFLERDGFQLELFQYRSPRPLPPERLHPNEDLKTIGTKHIAFAADDLSALLADCPACGADVVFSARRAGNQMCFLRDPDGVLVEFIQLPDARPPEKEGTAS